MKKELTFGRNRMLLLVFLLLSMSLSSCRKDKHNPMQFIINAYMPHTNAPVSGVKWKVVERKFKGLGQGHEETGWVMEGETDLNGQVNEEFIPFKNTDYSYLLVFDYSEMDVPNGEYSITKGPTDYALLNRSDMGGSNDFDVRILPMMSTQLNFKNLNCYDANDTFKYKKYNLDEKPHYTQAYIDGMSWLEGASLNGCVDFTGPYADRLAGHYIYIWEAVRNGITETGTDTFFVAPGVNSTINMHW